MTSAVAGSTRTVEDLMREVHPHLAELTYVENMPWLGTIVRTVADHVRDGVPVTDRMVDLALVGAERDHRAADTHRDPVATRPLAETPLRGRARGTDTTTETLTGVIAYRARARAGVRLLVRLPDGTEVWVTWPKAAETVRPGDSVSFAATVTRSDRGTRVSRLTDPKRVARPHEQRG